MDDMWDASKKRIEAMLPFLDERQRRLFLAAEANGLGYGGLKFVSEASGVSAPTIISGQKELEEGAEPLPDGRVRKKGGGRKSVSERSPETLELLNALIGSSVSGDPMGPLMYVSKSTRHLSAELKEKGFPASHTTVSEMLKEEGYRMQGCSKSISPNSQHPDRDAQFDHINAISKECFAKGCPVLSVDAKKKELVGNFSNGGTEYHRSGDAPKVMDHDFELKTLGKASPYGVYDVFRNAGFVNIGVGSDTAEFAVESIRRWWEKVGSRRYPDAESIMITADCGGSNGYRLRLWKLLLQELADETGRSIAVCHYPPGTSKWNAIEHRLFSFISMNWRGRPLISTALIMDLISSTSTTKGLTVECMFDGNTYERGRKVSDEEFDGINIEFDEFHGEWNYTIRPRKN